MVTIGTFFQKNHMYNHKKNSKNYFGSNINTIDSVNTKKKWYLQKLWKKYWKKNEGSERTVPIDEVMLNITSIDTI